MKFRTIPAVIRKVGFDFYWDLRKLWVLKYPVSNMRLKNLEWHFDYPFLWHNGDAFNLKPWKVIRNPRKYKYEYRRIIKADLDYPIDIMKNKGKWMILDGLHRLMKAKMQRLKKVHVRKIPRSAIPKIIKERERKLEIRLRPEKKKIK